MQPPIYRRYVLRRGATGERVAPPRGACLTGERAARRILALGVLVRLAVDSREPGWKAGVAPGVDLTFYSGGICLKRVSTSMPPLFLTALITQYRAKAMTRTPTMRVSD